MAGTYENWPRKPFEETRTCDMFKNAKTVLRKMVKHAASAESQPAIIQQPNCAASLNGETPLHN